MLYNLIDLLKINSHNSSYLPFGFLSTKESFLSFAFFTSHVNRQFVWLEVEYINFFSFIKEEK